MEHTQSIPGTATEIALHRLLATLTADDAAVLEWFATTMRGDQRARGEPERANATDALIAMFQQGLAEQRRAKRIAEAFAAEAGEL